MKRISLMEKKIASQKEKILEYLSDSGNVSFACKRVGIARKTFYRWKDEDFDFYEEAESAIEFGKSYINDLAHNQLVKKIQEGDPQLIRFQLASCHPDYRIRPLIRVEQSDKPIEYIELQPINVSQDEIEAIKKGKHY